MIKAENVSFEYIRRDDEGNVSEIVKAVDGIDLHIKKGEFVALLGHNGSGKSTFAKGVNAILTPSEGDLYVAGYNTKDEDNIWLIRQSAGEVFQNPDNQLVASVVEEDVAFGPENLGVESNEIFKRVEYALNAVGMSAYRFSSPNALSGGQKQRIAIAGILAMRPKCIILDEPTAMLDPKGRKEVIKTLTELNKKENITIVLVTHYMEEVVNADRVIVMDDGKIVMSGTPREVFSKVSEIKSHRLSVPQVTELAYLLKQKGIDLPDGVLTSDEFVECFMKAYNENMSKMHNKA